MEAETQQRARLIVTMGADTDPGVFDLLTVGTELDLPTAIDKGLRAFNEAFQASMREARESRAERGAERAA